MRASAGGLSGWKIANIRGVDIRIHFTLLFLLVYVVLIASVQFPIVLKQSGLDPEAISGSPGLWGGIFAVGLFLSVLIHEFAHTLVAQSMGVKVQAITLMMLGGVSEMEKIPEKRYAEFKVSVVGPLTSFGIAGLLIFAGAYSNWEEFRFFSFWLARVNLALGIFNLLPAFPLDGGRAFRSLLAAKFGMERATGLAVRVAQTFAWVLGILSLASGNLLLLLIALFIYSAAVTERSMMASRSILRGTTVRDAWTETDPVTELETLQSAAEKMLRLRIRALPVLAEEGTPTILPAEIVRRIPNEQWREQRVRDGMLKVARFVSPEDPLDEIFPELGAQGALPVLVNGSIRGIITYANVAEILELKRLSNSADRPQRRAA
ncbi:MAG TPA: hypothetical protein DCS07_10050 [Bdellovibrionales bacterium]|nr:MAG: hypothetical protein A2Z97_15205 [Bdellovibrionales bacterium GWB1_52_6]OFZ05926.1 MAG: hypothetical protein A2X97_01140 [Bdellovibrionales bacterium GWA1_52_35]OFZ33183.1 MAG: hypothetical protein A2070_15280 [Bdellovibrionales bacterium GWC1_52_8]HAR42953.1 hypothetical protein [Bdellovibrionales bacterium]HCM41669.1 hypothetical protein [Bdellovibrionales bacterium]